MYCPKCGSQVADVSVFCSSCGSKITVANNDSISAVQNCETDAFQTQKNAVRNSEMNVLLRAKDYFMQKKSTFDEYDMVCEKLNHYAKGARIALIVWGGILTMAGYFFTLREISLDNNVIIPLILFFIPGLGMLIGGILALINNKVKFRHYQKEYERLSQELYAHYIAYENCPIGPEYSNPDIISVIMTYLQSGRADTIKESINVAISDATREDINEYLRLIQYNTEVINSRTKVATFFAAASFFR